MTLAGSPSLVLSALHRRGANRLTCLRIVTVFYPFGRYTGTGRILPSIPGRLIVPTHSAFPAAMSRANSALTVVAPLPVAAQISFTLVPDSRACERLS